MLELPLTPDTTDDELLRILIKEKAVSISLSNVQVRTIQKNWEKFHIYWESKSKKPGSLSTAIKGAKWLCHRAFTNIKQPNLHALISLYCEQGHFLEPVDFEKLSDNKQRILLRLKYE